MEEMGKLLMYTGLILISMGILIIALSKFGGFVPIGKLPGDIYIKKDHFSFYFPLGTSIFLSLLFSLLFTFFVILLGRK